MQTALKQVLAARTGEELLEAATALAEADLRLRRALVEARREAGMSQSEVADALGVKQSSVAAFERYDNDPRLSTIRRYALAVGVQIGHDVTRSAFGAEWKAVSGVLPVKITCRSLSPSFTLAAAADAKSTDFAMAA